MKRVALLSFAAVLAAGAAIAQSDIIKTRQAEMKEAGAATGAAARMLRGQAPFDLATAQKTLNTYVTISEALPKQFPEGTQNGDTAALPTIWSDKAGFDKAAAKWGADAKAALASITDEASFKTAMPGVMANCGACHEVYRAKR